MEKLKEYLNEISKVFGHKNNAEFFQYLKNISKPNNQVCNKRVAKGEGGWKCLDCEIDSLSLICNSCFMKSRINHKNHKILFNKNSNGYCDCGDPNVLNKEGFCSDHKGPFNNKNDLINFIKSSIDENSLNIINDILNNIFKFFIEKMDIILNERYANDEEKNSFVDEILKLMEEFIKFIDCLYKSNLSLFYFVTLKFTENFPLETNHKCFNYNEEQKKLTIIKETYNEKNENENEKNKHKCICPFFQIIIYFFIIIKKKTNFNEASFFTLFIQNYLNKLITSISYLHTFTYLNEDDNLSIFRGMGFQLLSEEIFNLLYSEGNIFFLENFFDEIYNKFKGFITKEEYKSAELMILRVYEIVKYLPIANLMDKIDNNCQIFEKLIDIIGLINNLNIFNDQIKFDKFQRDGFLFNILNIELFSLNIANLMSFLINFDKLQSTQFIFKKIISKIKEYKTYKENLLEKNYSPHIVYIRYYSIFLNRFCFHYSIKNDCDLLDSFIYFQSIIPESKEINTFLFKELIIFFGFIISQKYSFFVYFGERMKLFYMNYFSYRPYILADITLMKYLLTLPEIQNEFTVEKILSYTNIASCNNNFINLIKEEKFEEKINENFKKEEKVLKYINSIFEFLLLIIRDNSSMINLSFKLNNSFRMKYKDLILEQLLKNEKNNFENLIKYKLIHFILGNKNLIKRENCLRLLYNFENYMDLKIIDNFLKDNCDEISLSNQLKQFSLKKNMFPLCDTDYIIDYKERINAFKYLIEFQKDFNLLNTYIIKPLNIQEKLYKKNYEIFFNNNFFGKIKNFYKNIITNENYGLFRDIYFFNFSKIICFYIQLYKDDALHKDNISKIIEIINVQKMEKNNEKLIQYMKKLLLNESNKDNEQKNKNKIKSLQEKI